MRMGFVDGIERQRQIKSQQLAAEEEFSRRMQALREETQEKARRSGEDERQRRCELRVRAMQESMVPEMVHRLRKALGNWENEINPRSELYRIEVPKEQVTQPIAVVIRNAVLDLYDSNIRHNYYNREKYYFDAQGLENGAVRIGRQVLSPLDAKDPTIVDKALESAYRTPTRLRWYEADNSYNEKCGQ